SIYKFLKIIEEEGLENAKKWEKAQDNKPSKLDFSWFVAYMQNADMALAINEHLHSKIGNEDTTTADVLRAYVLNDRAFIYYRVGLYGKAMELQRKAIHIREKWHSQSERRRGRKYPDRKLMGYRKALDYYTQLQKPF